MIVVDNFIKSPCRVRRTALKSDFIDWQAPDGETYKRIAITEVAGLVDSIQAAVGEIELLGSGYRLNYGGEQPNNSIHTDLGWGSHACVLYLSNGIGGTAFWKHKATGADGIKAHEYALADAIDGDWGDEGKWDQIGLCEIKFNRAVIYESDKFHSRYPFAAFGDNKQNGRLIAVAFFNIK